MNAQKLPFSTRMRELRKEKGWKQIDLAEKAGIDKNMISYYENGKYIPSADALMKIAEAFDVSIDYLLIENIQKKPLRQKIDLIDSEVVELLMNFNKLTDTEKESLKNIIESLVTKNQITELATRAS
jgi:transcriptional regulator with XRE-family HTH domain